MTQHLKTDIDGPRNSRGMKVGDKVFLPKGDKVGDKFIGDKGEELLLIPCSYLTAIIEETA